MRTLTLLIAVLLASTSFAEENTNPLTAHDLQVACESPHDMVAVSDLPRLMLALGQGNQHVNRATNLLDRANRATEAHFQGRAGKDSLTLFEDNVIVENLAFERLHVANQHQDVKVAFQGPQTESIRKKGIEAAGAMWQPYHERMNFADPAIKLYDQMLAHRNKAFCRGMRPLFVEAAAKQKSHQLASRVPVFYMRGTQSALAETAVTTEPAETDNQSSVTAQ